MTECIPKVVKHKDAWFYALSSSPHKGAIEGLKQDLIRDQTIYSALIRKYGDDYILYQRTNEKVAKHLMETTPCFGKEPPELWHVGEVKMENINKGRTTIDAVKQINKEKGQYWFSPGAMSFFRSRIERDTLRFGQLIDDKYFVTSEQFDDVSPRLYTVRRFNPDDGRIKTVGEFQEFKTKGIARDFAWCLADHDEDVEMCRGLVK